MTKARDLANASTALSAVSATELGYLDGVTSAVQTQIDAKLATATASSTYQPLVSGVSNTEIGYLDGVTSAIQTQLNQKPEVVAGKNFIINGGMDIWQRGTSFSSPSAAYTADRICATPSAGGTTWSVSQVASFLTGSRYAIRVQRASGQTGTPALYLGGALETSDVIKLQGQTVTWSFYAKAGSNFSPTGSGVAVQFNTGTGTDQGPFIGHTGEVAQVNTSATLSTTATRYTYTFTVPTNATSMRWNIAMTPSGTAGTNDFYDLTNMQLEVGSVATPFSRAGGTIQGELAACQRYYEHNYPLGYFPASNYGSAAPHELGMFIVQVPVTGSATVNRGRGVPMPFAVNKRTTPSMRIWDSAGNQNKYLAADTNGGFLSNNNALDIYGGANPTIKFATMQTVAASSAHIYCAFFWEASAEL